MSLIVENFEDYISLLRWYLECYSHSNVVIARTFEAAINEISKNAFDLILINSSRVETTLPILDYILSHTSESTKIIVCTNDPYFQLKEKRYAAIKVIRLSEVSKLIELLKDF